jgi:polyisoprenoid-binding protein YceI
MVHDSELLLKVISLLISLFTAGTFTTGRFASTTTRSGHTDADRIDGSLTQSGRS